MAPEARARRSRRRASRAGTALAAGLALLALATGCAGRDTRGRGGPPTASLREVLLFPLNVVVALPAGLEDAVEVVETELRDYLDPRVGRIERIGVEEAHAAWLASAQALRAKVGEEKMSFEGAAALLARQLGVQRRFDALVLPWIVMRQAKVRGRSVSWDGVMRTLRVRNPEGRSLQILGDFQAQAAAPSLQIAVFAPDGAKLFEGVGGLDLLHVLVLEGQPTRIDAELLPRAQVFADRTRIEEGIALAFEPLLPAR